MIIRICNISITLQGLWVIPDIKSDSLLSTQEIFTFKKIHLKVIKIYSQACSEVLLLNYTNIHIKQCMDTQDKITLNFRYLFSVLHKIIDYGMVIIIMNCTRMSTNIRFYQVVKLRRIYFERQYCYFIIFPTRCKVFVTFLISNLISF